ncbi:hypothetical protein [Exiguobacterium acetylicum]|uniref:hypothetical protein n=1 Tax=Exiguobacterium acetylicum TaxID=41170 RepID=UPI001EE26C94|nr:hypothetical protein [Exiguobacterium acetylicum]UKS57294.1 hypothetical protein K6T22_06680 [Exiguobacterium acetylicum]
MKSNHKQIINAKLKLSIKNITDGENNCYYDVDKIHEEKSIKSHSIWNNGILKLLAENNKIFWIDPKMRFKLYGEEESLFHEVITKNATVYRGFCGEHDNKLFEQIEKDSSYEGTLIQNFLYSYRAFSYQHVQNKLSKLAYEDMYQEIRKMVIHKIDGLNENTLKNIDELIKLHNKKRERGDAIFTSTKEKFNASFKNIHDEKCFNNSINENFVFKFFKINKKIEVACSGIGDPLIDIDGKKIITPTSGFLFLNLFPISLNESYFILGLLKKDEKIYKKIIEYLNLEYQKYNESQINNFELFVQNLIVNGSENIVMSPKLYHKLNLNGDIEKFEKQFNGSIALSHKEQKLHQNLLADNGYKLI